VAYAVRVLHSERAQFEGQQGWTIKRMDTLEQNPVHKDDYAPEALEPSPIQEEYAPVIFAQDTISHVVSIDLLSGKVSFFSIFCIFCSDSLVVASWPD
jgi:histidine kinase 2/3/4 (cytokinin receptor)